MDAGGNNRYELLFMDDDGENSDQIIVQKKNPGNAPATSESKKTSTSKKLTNQECGKQNKSGTLNKDTIGSKKEQKIQVSLAVITQNKQTGKWKRNVTVDRKTDDRHLQNKNSEFGNSNERQQKQFRDRENRPPRSRDGNSRRFTGKREFDRQSGSDKTGVKAIDKRDGAGAHNWGSVKQEIEDINTVNSVIDGVLIDKEDSANEQTTEIVNLPEAEEVKEMTLDEWKAMRQQRAKPKYNIRKPGEGEDTAQWKKMVVLNKKKNDDSEEELEYDPSMYPQRVGRLQRIVDIQFNFKDGRRGGGNFAGKGRAPRHLGIGEKNRFAGNDNTALNNISESRNFREKHNNAATKIDYESQFPTLS